MNEGVEVLPVGVVEGMRMTLTGIDYVIIAALPIAHVLLPMSP